MYIFHHNEFILNFIPMKQFVVETLWQQPHELVNTCNGNILVKKGAQYEDFF